MIHPALDQADEDLLALIQRQARKVDCSLVHVTFPDLMASSGLALRQIVTSLCRLHLCGQVKVKFGLDSRYVHVRVLHFRPNVRCNG